MGVSHLSISVVIPTYDGEAFVGAALASAQSQTRLPMEIIVVDDASTDRTVHLVEEMAGRTTLPVRLIRLPQNSGGPAHPMNVGIAEARGDLIAVLDQDDVFLPNRL